MRRSTVFVAALLAWVVAPRVTQAAQAPQFAGGSQVVLVAPVPEAADFRAGHLQIPIGPERTMYTLEAGPQLETYAPTGGRLNDARLQRGWWIRATGTVGDNPNSFRISNLQVLGPETDATQSAFYRRGFPQGYVMSVAGTREVYPRVSGMATVEPTILVGRVIDDSQRGMRRLRIKAGPNEWTLNVADNAAFLSGKGEAGGSLDQITSGQWIRAEGWQTDDLGLRVVQIRAIGAGDDAYRSSQYFRPEYMGGYVTRVTADRLTTQPFRVSGTVTQINRPMGYFVVRGEDGKEHTVYSEGTRFRQGNRQAGFDALKEGDKVTVTGRLISAGRPQ